MPINVVCPGCLKRFQVSERFAGLKGPCPSCNTIIDIPKEKVKIHAPEEARATGGKSPTTGRPSSRPLSRVGVTFKLREFYYVLGASALLLLLALVLGLVLPQVVRNVLGALALIALSVPIAMYGYLTVRDPEDLFIWSGRDLYRRSALCGGGYAFLWILMEILIWYTGAASSAIDFGGQGPAVPVYLWFFLILFGGFSVLLPHVIFDFEISRALTHYLTFLVPTIILRGVFGLGWIWQVVERIRTIAPPPPPM